MNVTLPIHASIISDHGIELQPSQESGLIKALRRIQSDFSRQVVLHHGCGTRADDIAHLFARKSGWRIEGHPASPAVSVVPRQLAAFRGHFEVSHPARPQDDRDLELIWASTIIVAVESDRGRTSRLLSQATAAGWQVTHIEAAKFHGESPAAVFGPAHDWLVDAWR